MGNTATAPLYMNPPATKGITCSEVPVSVSGMNIWNGWDVRGLLAGQSSRGAQLRFAGVRRQSW